MFYTYLKKINKQDVN